MSEANIRRRKEKLNRNGIFEDSSHKGPKDKKNVQLLASRTSMFIFFILSIIVSLLLAILLLEIKDRRDEVEQKADYTQARGNNKVDYQSFDEMPPPEAKVAEKNKPEHSKSSHTKEEKKSEPFEAQNQDSGEVEEPRKNKHSGIEPKIAANSNDDTPSEDENISQDEPVPLTVVNKTEGFEKNAASMDGKKEDVKDSVKAKIDNLDRPIKGKTHIKSPKATKNSSQQLDKEEDKPDKKLLRDLYIEVEGLADDILSRDPKNEMLMLLAPHLERVLKDMENGKYSGVEDALIHAKETLEAVNERLSRNGVSGTPQPVLSPKDLEDVKEILNPSNSPDGEGDSVAVSSEEGKTEDAVLDDQSGGNDSISDGSDDRKPVDEVIPEPVYIAPLGDKEDVETRNQKDDSKVSSSEMAGDGEKTNNQQNLVYKKKLEEAISSIQEDPRKALKIYDGLLEGSPGSFDILYGRAQALDLLAEREKSNSILEEAIQAYRSLLDLTEEQLLDVDDDTYLKIGLTCATRMTFRGWHSRSIQVLQQLTQRFPDDIAIQNKVGVALLMINQPSTAYEVFKKVLDSHPNDGFAQVHYGFILKTTFENNTEGVKYLERGIHSGAQGTSDGRFYFHLGDGLQRLGQEEEAYKVYDEGVEKGLFMSRYQRSLYNVERLTSRPLWSQEQTTYTKFFSKLESQWKEIRDEALKILSDDMTKGFVPETENLHDTGDWQQLDLFSRGKKVKENCAKAPKTCALIEQFAPAASCKRGQAKFSLMQPSTHVWSHTGPTNCRLRAHLGLVVPLGVKMRVAEDFITWEEGKILIFDDSFEHEVWHEGDTPRLVLIVDVWHPELTESERRSLSPI